MRPWPLGVVVIVLGLTTWLALAPGTTFPLPALAALADAGVPAVLQPYRADLPHLLGFAGLVVLFTALLGRAGVAAALVLGFATLLEAMQLFVPWREASWADLRVNLLGLGLNAGALTSLVGETVGAAAPALDGVIEGLTGVLGLHLGEADARVNALRCGRTRLV